MKRKILVVEDEEVLSSAYRTILEKAGFKVKIANTGKEAIEILKNFQPSVIFLDLLMPEMDGVDFLKEYKPPVAKKPKIVVFSNLPDKQQIEKVYNLGASDFVVKSRVTPEQLCEIAEK